MDYISHLRRDKDQYGTACGSAWQGWQEPEGRTPLDPPPTGPHAKPAPHTTLIRMCAACLGITLGHWPGPEPKIQEAKVCPVGQPLNRCCMDTPCALLKHQH